jgi:ferredoxin
MRVKVDVMRCIASGACRLTAPAIFGQDEDGIVRVLDAEPPPELHAAARAAAAGCPAAVITIEEDA